MERGEKHITGYLPLFTAALGGVLMALAALGAPPAAAQDLGISISPPNFELNAQPGQVVSQEIVVSNHGGGGAIPIRIDATGFEPAGNLGQATITNRQTDVVTWTLVSPKEFILEPGGLQAVRFIIDVPPDAPPGGHYLSILASLDAGGGVSVGQRVGALVLLRVAGEVKEELRVAAFTGPGLAARGRSPSTSSPAIWATST